MYHASETQAATAEDKHSFSTTYSSPSATVTNWDFNKDGRFGNNNCSGVDRVINNSRVLQSRSTAVITTAPDVKDAIQQQAKAPCYSFALFSRDPQSWNRTKALPRMPAKRMGALRGHRADLPGNRQPGGGPQRSRHCAVHQRTGLNS